VADAGRARRPKTARELLLEELREVYSELDRLHDGWSCACSTECCRFGITGVEPYVTSIEVLAVEVALAERGGPLGPGRRAGPLVGVDASARPVRDERTCPFLDSHGQCAVYAARPIGCRTYLCARAEGPAEVERATLLDLVRRVQDIAARHAPSGDKPHRFGRIYGV
jgi:Fe-S-cluster containining protein